jgi:hypothetical protein
MCTDYRELNAESLKNWYSPPLIDDHFIGSQEQNYSRIRPEIAYHRVCTRVENRLPHTAQYLVVPFGLTNAPAAFQSYVNQTLREYLDNLIVYPKREEDHESMFA